MNAAANPVLDREASRGHDLRALNDSGAEQDGNGGLDLKKVISYVVREYGDDLKHLSEKRCLLLANHLGLVDHFALMLSLNNKGSVPGRWLWIIYNIWKWTPLGVMWTLHGNFFINGGASQRDGVLAQLKRHISSYFHKYDLTWIVMYPEGSRLYLIEESNKRFAERNNLTPLKNCAFPRTGAAHAVLSVLGPQEGSPDQSRCGNGPPIEYIIDATIGYKKGLVPELKNAILGDWPMPGSHRIHIHWQAIPVRPEWGYNEEALKNFLYDRYEKKDRMLKDFYQNDKFEGEHRTEAITWQAMIFSQVFWVVLFYIHFLLIIRPIYYLFY
ncbi:hypothetical protein WR25_07575 [Diploscapter pachys]|uniref:Phospholipid/glycerol acyltransferase domain-containing protein n=1 Tax=Diploscapter pachys TaxID=2018661 RepID=A0A2A2LQC6_9BILA|nr:hypothetical protein WR25_07575 [Diploscapter pachys]